MASIHQFCGRCVRCEEETTKGTDGKSLHVSLVTQPPVLPPPQRIRKQQSGGELLASIIATPEDVLKSGQKPLLYQLFQHHQRPPGDVLYACWSDMIFLTFPFGFVFIALTSGS